MSLPDEVEKVLAKVVADWPDEAPQLSPANADMMKSALLLTLVESVHALKEAVLLIAYEVENLRAAVEARDDPPSAG